MSTLVNSFASASHVPLLWLIIFETSDHFPQAFDPDMKLNRLSNKAIVTVSASPNTAKASCFFLGVFNKIIKIYYDLFLKFIFSKYFLTSADRSPRFLLTIDWISLRLSFICDKPSLEMLHRSKILMDPSRSFSI